MLVRRDRKHFLKILCKQDGSIKDVVTDEYKFFSGQKQESNLVVRIPLSERWKFKALIKNVAVEGVAYCKDLPLLNSTDEEVFFSLLAVLQEDLIIIIAIQIPNHLNTVFDEFMEMFNEQGRLLRKAQKDASTTMRSQTEIVDTYVQTNNDLSNLHRELQKKTFQLEQAYKKIEEISRIDPLTNVLNRHYFTLESSEELKRCKRYGLGACVLYLDIDHFKSINDQYGHAVGDYGLVQFAALCSLQLRENDLFGRMGGEEFCALLLHSNIEEAAVIAERIRGIIEKKTFRFENHHFSITTSIGIASYRYDEGIEKLIRRADDALYKAKKAGRNRVFCS